MPDADRDRAVSAGGVYDWRGLLRRKEELAEEFAAEEEADWLIHLDPDELRLPPPGAGTLAEALAEDVRLPGESELRFAADGEELDVSQPRERHFVDELPVGS